MEAWQMITGSILGVITVLLGIYISFTIRQKGPIFSNTYIWLSKREREKADKKAEYRLVTVIFSGLCVLSFCETLYIFTQRKIFLAVVFIAIGFDLIYAIYDAAKRANKS